MNNTPSSNMDSTGAPSDARPIHYPDFDETVLDQISSLPSLDTAFRDNLSPSNNEAWIFRNRSQLKDDDDSSSSVTDPYANTPPTDSTTNGGAADSAEVVRLKRELKRADERMALMFSELGQSRVAQHALEEAIKSGFAPVQHPAATTSNRNILPAASGLAQVGGFVPTSTTFDRPVFAMPQYAVNPAGSIVRPISSFSMRSSNSTTPAMQPQYHVPRPAPPNGVIVNNIMQPSASTRLNARASEFGLGRSQFSTPPPPPPPQQQVSSSGYMNITEPLNYRRLLERNASCDWKYIVDKIVCSNDQQASIFLQQKLKVATNDAKFDIIQAIIDQAYGLMINRFGNFLVQRCFEHGTPEQVIAIAQAIRGNTLALSMDAFGCHVVQKAFDCVPEEYKAIMVHELLRRIPETVIHRYACHVWQKLFELRWSDSPPQIMKYVNEALRGMWHEVALGETGSLVVQNIFENCLEEDKRPCISEVLASIDVVAHGQFGNWCIQHICEHGSIPDRTRAIDHVLRFATEYSMDQFASKVVEKCLKIGGTDFLDRYLDRVVEARPDRPRMPLIDIAGDQFGNYLIQYILSNGDPQRREVVAAHIRKHMVSLRGSKYGSRVAMLCCNHAVATRPGPVGSLQSARYSGITFGRPEHYALDGQRSAFGVDRGYVGRGSFGGAFR